MSKVEEQTLDSLMKVFYTGPGSHLGLINWKSSTIKKEGFYIKLKQDFQYLLDKGWSYNELEDMLKEAKVNKRPINSPNELTDNRVPAKLRKNPDRNLLDTNNYIGYHPAIKKRSMPTIKLVVGEDGMKTKVTSQGSEVLISDTFTLRDLCNYWLDSSGARLGSYQELCGSFSWLLERYSLVTILFAIDDMCIGSERVVKKSITPFDLKDFLVLREEDNSFIYRNM